MEDGTGYVTTCTDAGQGANRWLGDLPSLEPVLS